MMTILAHTVIALSFLGAIVTGLGGLLLAWILLGSYSDSDRHIGLWIALITVLYGIHPIFNLWLLWQEKMGLSILGSIISLGLSVWINSFIWNAVEAAARP